MLTLARTVLAFVSGHCAPSITATVSTLRELIQTFASEKREARTTVFRLPTIAAQVRTTIFPPALFSSIE